MLVLGLESGVRGIFGLEANGDSDEDLPAGCSTTRGGGLELLSVGVGFVPCLVLEGLSSAAPLVVALEPCLDLDDVVGLLCCSDFGCIVDVTGRGVLSCIASVTLAPGVVGLVRG